VQPSWTWRTKRKFGRRKKGTMLDEFQRGLEFDYVKVLYDQITEHHIHIENEADDKDKSQE
jgi:hypothetical protein